MLPWFWYSKHSLVDKSFATSYKHYEVNKVYKPVGLQSLRVDQEEGRHEYFTLIAYLEYFHC